MYPNYQNTSYLPGLQQYSMPTTQSYYNNFSSGSLYNNIFGGGSYNSYISKYMGILGNQSQNSYITAQITALKNQRNQLALQALSVQDDPDKLTALQAQDNAITTQLNTLYNQMGYSTNGLTPNFSSLVQQNQQAQQSSQMGMLLPLLALLSGGSTGNTAESTDSSSNLLQQLMGLFGGSTTETTTDTTETIGLIQINTLSDKLLALQHAALEAKDNPELLLMYHQQEVQIRQELKNLELEYPALASRIPTTNTNYISDLLDASLNTTKTTPIEETTKTTTETDAIADLLKQIQELKDLINTNNTSTNVITTTPEANTSSVSDAETIAELNQQIQELKDLINTNNTPANVTTIAPETSTPVKTYTVPENTVTKTNNIFVSDTTTPSNNTDPELTTNFSITSIPSTGLLFNGESVRYDIPEAESSTSFASTASISDIRRIKSIIYGE